MRAELDLTRPPLVDAELAVAFVELDAEPEWDEAELCVEGCEERLADVAGEELGRCIGDGKEAAVAAGKSPAATLEGGSDFVGGLR